MNGGLWGFVGLLTGYLLGQWQAKASSSVMKAKEASDYAYYMKHMGTDPNDRPAE